MFFSDATFVAEGGNGKVYKATKYKANGSKDTTAAFVIKEVGTLLLAQQECTEYTSLPVNVVFAKCFGSTGDTSVGYAVLEDAGPDLRKYIKDGHVASSRRRKMIKGLLKALKVLFDAGKAHRDVKPGNACYQNHKLKLIDFGMVYDWNTQVTLTNINGLQAVAKHGTRIYRWPAVEALMVYSDTDKASATTKQAYVDRVKSKFYLIDLGGIFLIHVSLITRESDKIKAAGDVFTYYATESTRTDDGKTFWTRYHVGTNERAVLEALKSTDKSYADILAMAWFH